MANPDPKILLRRGTDTERTDGTLGTPQQGEPCYTTDTKALFIGDGATAGGIPATVPASAIQLIAVTTQNINAAATNLFQWAGGAPAWGVDFTFSAATDNTKITINTTGTYLITASIAFTTTQVRYNGFLDVLQNGTAVGPTSACGYVRAASGHDNGSLHIPQFMLALSATDYLQLQVTRESSPTGTVTSIARRSLFTVMRLK